MNRFSTFVLGLVLGSALMFAGLKYHVVRASDGFHMVAKSTAKLSPFYSDVRTYTVDDWQGKQELMLDITNSGNKALQEEAAKSAMGNTFDGAWDSWSGVTP